ncbi:hypothetical protein Smp_147270 [Schistosoma mansoni]|uniref:hypothetical protein n=1 Tax=Schistosoma mansoni TaxID=6183 RepID=UPI0001A63D90|nr:hypothetical protein Smp_147270 [Schistosoma mansoni]|eukprot:XP_018650275.1 hypothetical protein Smp_147270 [Schistosoma mansoni]
MFHITVWDFSSIWDKLFDIGSSNHERSRNLPCTIVQTSCSQFSEHEIEQIFKCNSKVFRSGKLYGSF